MEDLAGMRYKIINQMLKNFIEQEKKFFETCYFLINNFYKGMGILEQSLPYQKTSYDPMKYIRANKIMEGVDANSLPNIKMKDKYSLNNYKNSSSMPINNNENFNKKYSFEDYKLRKSNMQNNSNINNINTNQNNINNINIINNNNQDKDLKPLNPYSYEAYKKRTQSLDTIKRQHLNNNNSNNNTNYYQSNLNLVMNSIIGKENITQTNPFGDIKNNKESNPYSNNDNNNNSEINPYNINNKQNNNTNNNNDSDDIPNPYASIFNNQINNQSNNKNIINSFFNENKGNNQQNNNNNNFKKPQDKYNFGF